jgi:hypothetical protein
LFVGINSQFFFTFVDQINNIDYLSSAIYSSVTLKICVKLSPILAAKFIMHYQTDSRVYDLIRGIYNRMVSESSFRGKTKWFLKNNAQRMACVFGVTLGSMIGYKYLSARNIFVVPKRLIIPSIISFSKVILYSCYIHAEEFTNAHYMGFRETFIQSGLELLKQIKELVIHEVIPT